MAVEASKAWMPRKSRCSALGGVAQRCQSLPSLVVRRTVPSVPEAQAIPLPTLWMPRRSAVVWDASMSHWACVLLNAANRNVSKNARRCIRSSLAKAAAIHAETNDP